MVSEQPPHVGGLPVAPLLVLLVGLIVRVVVQPVLQARYHSWGTHWGSDDSLLDHSSPRTHVASSEADVSRIK